MQPALSRAANAYYQTHVQSRSPLELVVMLYDAALRFMTEAREAMRRRDMVAKRGAISRALAVVAELQNTLNMKDGGQTAATLDSLYTYITERLLDANTNGSVEPIEESIRLVSPLRDAWSQIAAPQAHAVPVTR